MSQETVYVATKQLGSSSPLSMSVYDDLDRAVELVADGYDGVPADLDEWERRQGNQHIRTTYWYWTRTNSGNVVNHYIRKMEVE